MTAQEHEDGMRQEPTLSAAEKADGFAAVMKRLRSHSLDERARLQTQAEEVVLGYEAYALGQEYLGRGDYEAARRWLGVAAGHRIPGAAQAREEIARRQTLDGFPHLAAVSDDQAAVSCETITSPHALRVVDGNHRSKGDQTWTFVMERLYADRIAAAAREQAGQITAQARRDADAILAAARHQADTTATACAELVLATEKDRRKAAELLAEARQVAETARSEAAEIGEAAWRSAGETMATAQRQALLILDDARSEAVLIRGRSRGQGREPSRAGTPAGGSLVQYFLKASLEGCTLAPAGNLDDHLWGAHAAFTHRLPVTTRSRQSAPERLPQMPLSFGAAVFLIVEGAADVSTIPFLRAPQVRDEQDGAGPKSWSGVWQVLGVDADACDATLPGFARADRACGAAAGAARQGGLRVLAISLVKTDGQDVDGDAELGAEGVGSTGR
ncbi:hypothetical protein AB0O75_50120 [Streptomyces sp. NPDC088921]|uniref:hypothetical protein n=1 Tax=unclassified Streptomyces TaxID=2593676 RepID=UPI00343D248A